MHTSRAIIVLVFALALTGCSKRTYLKTTPVGAEAVLDDGRELGPTPILLEEDIWVWTEHTITFTKPGYKPEQLVLKGKAQPANIAACAIGVCVLWMGWPLCVVGKYQISSYNLTMERSANFDDYFSDEDDGTGSPGRIDSSSDGITWRAQPR